MYCLQPFGAGFIFLTAKSLLSKVTFRHLWRRPFFTKPTLNLSQLTIINMIAVWDSEKLWAVLKKIQLWSLIPLKKQITFLTNDIFLPIHAPSKCDDWETVWAYQMCADDDNLFLTGLSEGQLALCINAFLEIPSCIRWTLQGLFEPLHILSEGKRGKRIFFSLWKDFNLNEMRADWHPGRFLFKTTLPMISCSRWGKICLIHKGLWRYIPSLFKLKYLLQYQYF